MFVREGERDRERETERDRERERERDRERERGRGGRGKQVKYLNLFYHKNAHWKGWQFEFIKPVINLAVGPVSPPLN